MSPTPFGRYLADAIKAAGISRREFARKVGYASSNIEAIIAGKRKPPVAHIDGWSKALGKEVDQAQFRKLALLAHAHPEIQEWVASMETRIQRMAKNRPA